jgi:hypothetical protein
VLPPLTVEPLNEAATSVVASMLLPLKVVAEITPALVIAIAVPAFRVQDITLSLRASSLKGKPRPKIVITVFHLFI